MLSVYGTPEFSTPEFKDPWPDTGLARPATVQPGHSPTIGAKERMATFLSLGAQTRDVELDLNSVIEQLED
jgi:hypothetical protein